MLMVAGNMVGSGIYLLPSSLAAIGTISLIGWIAAAAGSMVAALLFAHVAIRGAGQGFLEYVRSAFGPGTAVVTGFFYWAQGLLGNVAIALAITGYVSFFWPWAGTQPGAAIVTIAAIWLFIALNLLGPLRVAQWGSAMVVVGLAPVILVATLGWFSFDPAVFRAGWNVSGQPTGAAVMQSIVLVLWAFLGFETACAVAAQVRDPERNVPLATVGGLLIATALYVAASAAIGGLLPADILARSNAPFADATVVLLGTWAGFLVALSAAAKASGTLGGWTLVTAETARSTAMLNGAPGRRTPSARNLLLTGLLSTVAVIGSATPTIAGQFGFLINAVVVLILISYAITGAAAVKHEPASPRAWILGGGTVLLAAGVIATQPPSMLLLAAGALCIGLVLAAALQRQPVPA
jgi:amino acid transporter